MGADRKGPLAAFIVVAVIAVILLVTSVRSQAAPGWIQGRLPASIVAAVPAAPAPGVWIAVGDGVGSVVEHGVVLVHRATEDPTTNTGASISTVSPLAAAGVAPPHSVTTVASGPATQSGSASGTRTRSSRARAPHRSPVADTTTHGQGRHLGPAHAHHGLAHGHGTHGHGTHGHAHGPHGLHLGWARGS